MNLQPSKKQVELAVEFWARHPDIDQHVICIVRCHHERNDGLGFLKELRGEQILELARFANLAYCFERLIDSLSQDGKFLPAKATTRLYSQRDPKFSEQLVMGFIHLIGMDPFRTVIELNTGGSGDSLRAARRRREESKKSDVNQ
jgi:response regulator RpfG family c-di-GMP phosphodiesterase